MVACYAIGWRFTPQEAAEYPYIQPAKCADDLGKVIIFNSEAPEVTSSAIVPEGVKTFAINPLTWNCGTQKHPKHLMPVPALRITAALLCAKCRSLRGAISTANAVL